MKCRLTHCTLALSIAMTCLGAGIARGEDYAEWFNPRAAESAGRYNADHGRHPAPVASPQPSYAPPTAAQPYSSRQPVGEFARRPLYGQQVGMNAYRQP